MVIIIPNARDKTWPKSTYSSNKKQYKIKNRGINRGVIMTFPESSKPTTNKRRQKDNFQFKNHQKSLFLEGGRFSSHPKPSCLARYTQQQPPAGLLTPSTARRTLTASPLSLSTPSNVLRHHLQLKVSKVLHFAFSLPEVLRTHQASYGLASPCHPFFLHDVFSAPHFQAISVSGLLRQPKPAVPAFPARCLQVQGECHRHCPLSSPQVLFFLRLGRHLLPWCLLFTFFDKKFWSFWLNCAFWPILTFDLCSAREINKGDEIAWYADGDYTVRNESNSSIAYGFG